MNTSKKHRRLYFMKHNAYIFGIYEIRRRNTRYIYCDMKLIRIDKYIDGKVIYNEV